MAKKPRKGADSAPSKSEEAATPAATAPVGSIDTRPKLWSLIIALILHNNVRRAFYLVLLASMYAPLSQLILAPVYGSIPSGVYHKYGVIVSAMLSFLTKDYASVKVEQFFPAFVFWIPTIHLMLFPCSSAFGNPAGPLITECLTTYPLVMLSMHLANKNIYKLNLSFMNESVAEVLPAMYNYLVFTVMQRLFQGILPLWMGMNKLFTRIGLQMLTAAIYTAVIPQAFIWPALPAIAFTAVGNGHAPLQRTTELLENTLALYNYSLIERQESVTGYLSILQDNNNHFKVMRSDHSLLGGEWVLPADPKNKRLVAEPIFAVFTMLESVRLVEREKTTPNSGLQALSIGLGVGTVPSALIAHGINTTIVEIDPTIHRFAIEHFNLPKTHRIYIADAVGLVEAKREEQEDHYDYIVHDVFTGGAEPADLFTIEFLSGLKQMLKPDGVIALNYAGDLAMPSASLVYRTVTNVFPACRVFREDEQVDESDKAVVDDAGEFTNMVFICKKDGQAPKFRKAVEADFLGSASRKSYMVPKHEVPAVTFQQHGELLTRANKKGLEKMQVESAIGHWKLMRKVMPAAIWENW